MAKSSLYKFNWASPKYFNIWASYLSYTSKSLHRSSDYIFQEYLPGQEYTIDVLCDIESNPLIVIPRKRLQTKAGISSKGEIIKDNFIERRVFLSFS